MGNQYQELQMFKLPKGFRGKGAVVVQLWWIVQGSLFAWSPQFMYSWRNALLRLFGAKIGRGVIIRPSAKITYPWKVSIGDYSWIGDDVVIYSLGEITIGDNSVISQKSYLCGGGHDHTRKAFDIFSKPIHIGSEVWLGTDVFVAPGINIGKGAVVGARSSVFKDIQSGSMNYGYPCRYQSARVMKEG